jgi:hypothetical protein
MTMPSRVRHAHLLGAIAATGLLLACASDPGTTSTTSAMGASGSTGNSGHGRTASMSSPDEDQNSPTPGGMGGAASRTMAGGPGYWTLIGTETGASWKTPTLSGGGPTR